MADLDLNSVISLIMENPELVSRIKSLAEEEKAEENTEKAESAAVPVTVPKEVPRERGDKVTARRGELLRALSPYISDNRKKAIETFMSIADILDLMRAK